MWGTAGERQSRSTPSPQTVSVADLLRVELAKGLSVNCEGKHVANVAILIVFRFLLASDPRCICLVEHGIEDRLPIETWRETTPISRLDEIKLGLTNQAEQGRG